MQPLVVKFPCRATARLRSLSYIGSVLAVVFVYRTIKDQYKNYKKSGKSSDIWILRRFFVYSFLGVQYYRGVKVDFMCIIDT